MRFKFWPSLILFLGSYFPLSLILYVQNIQEKTFNAPLCNFETLSMCTFPMPDNYVRAWGLILITLLSLILLILFLKGIQPKSEIKIEEIKTIPNDLVNYVFPYVVSFMGLKLDNHGAFYGFLIFIFFMFLVTYKSGEIVMNPILILTGWRVYEVKGSISNTTRTFRAISKVRLYPNDLIGSRLAQDIYILINKK